MAYIIRCDRCGEEDDDPSIFETGPALADGWVNLNGTILCDKCNVVFRHFVKGEAIPPKKRSPEQGALTPTTIEE